MYTWASKFFLCGYFGAHVIYAFLDLLETVESPESRHLAEEGVRAVALACLRLGMDGCVALCPLP